MPVRLLKGFYSSSEHQKTSGFEKMSIKSHIAENCLSSQNEPEKIERGYENVLK